MKRSIVYGSNTVIAIGLFTIILLLINILPKELKALNLFGTRVPLQKQWDLTENKRFTLTDQSVKVLGRLNTQVTAIGFARKGSPGYQGLEDMLKQYAFQSPSFTYRIEDPDRNPLVAQQYGVKSMRTLILETKGADGKVKKDTVTLPVGAGNSDYQQMESKITAGLLRIINPKTATVYFTSGHGEAEIDDQNPQTGIASLKSALEGENYVLKSLRLFNEKVVPGDASLVLVAGLNKDFFPEEVQALQRYLSTGGRLLVFYNADPLKLRSFPNFDALLATQGIITQNDTVISAQIAPLNSRERLLAPAINKYGASPITEKFTVPTVYPVARSFKIEKVPKDATVAPLATTDPKTWEIRHPLDQQALLLLTSTEDPQRIFQPDKDTQGEAIVAVTGTYPAVAADLELAPQQAPAPAIPGATLSGAPSAMPSTAPSAAPSAISSSTPSAGPSTAPSGTAAPAATASGGPQPPPSPVPGATPEKPKSEARIVAFGSAQMIMGGFYGILGNGDLVMNSVAWLTERTDQIAISRPEAKKQPISLDEIGRRRLDWFAMPFMPMLVAALGLLVITLNRRH